MKRETQDSLVSIVILNWNGARYVEECIESVHRQGHREIEVIVVDNGSSDGSVETVRNRFPGVRLILHRENLGFAQGMNTGIAAASGEFILLLNEDACLDPDFVSIGLREFRRDPALAWVGGLVYAWRAGEKTDVIVNAASALKRRFQLCMLPDAMSRRESLMGSQCAMLLRRSALEDVRLEEGQWLDGSYFAYWEDTDLALRLWLRGWKCLFTPEMAAWHVVSGSFEGKQRLIDKPQAFQRMALRNRYRTILKNVPAGSLLVLMPPLLLAELLIIPYFALVSFRTLLASFGAMADVMKSIGDLRNKRRRIQDRRLSPERRILGLFYGF